MTGHEPPIGDSAARNRIVTTVRLSDCKGFALSCQRSAFRGVVISM